MQLRVGDSGKIEKPNNMKKAVITTDSDATLCVVLGRPDGTLSCPLGDGEEPRLAEDMFIGLRVGREEWERRVFAEGPVAGAPEVGETVLWYVEEQRGGERVCRMVRPDDARSTWRRGRFVCINVFVPRGTFSSIGALEVRQATYKPDGHFAGRRRKEWTLYAETGVRYVRV